MEKRKSFLPNNRNNSEAAMENDWGNATANSNLNGWGSLVNPMTSEATSNISRAESHEEEYNGWGLLVGPMSSKASITGWMDEPPKEKYSGWGSSVGTTTSEANSIGLRVGPSEEEYNGWGSLVGPTTLKANGNGWMDEPPEKEYNGWRDEPPREDCNGLGSCSGTIASEASSKGWMDEPPKEESHNTSQHKQTAEILTPILESKPNYELHNSISSAPSAPPLPEQDFNEDPIDVSYPIVDFSSASVEKEASRMNEAIDGSASSSSCVVCWEASVEGACVPCGHMAACMECLNDVKSKQGACPVCRAKIDQVIKIYVT